MRKRNREKRVKRREHREEEKVVPGERRRHRRSRRIARRGWFLRPWQEESRAEVDGALPCGGRRYLYRLSARGNDQNTLPVHVSLHVSLTKEQDRRGRRLGVVCRPRGRLARLPVRNAHVSFHTRFCVRVRLDHPSNVT
ncbi:hypothetical protein BHE74_00004073 [Ensete ventricosum]|nr:hypothetical protein BHE74_00004073 [Ensete ventricosum]